MDKKGTREMRDESLDDYLERNNLFLCRELTDEEIEECFAESCSDFKLLENGKTKGIVDIIEVGRAILRKAQEK